jgi:putative endopeptidase
VSGCSHFIHTGEHALLSLHFFRKHLDHYMKHYTFIFFSLASFSIATAGSGAPSDARVEHALPFAPQTYDRGVDVCVDPYAYVNNHWLRNTEIPADRPMWGPRYAVVGENQRMQRELAESAAAAIRRGEASDMQALVGAFYASGMHEAVIEAVGLGAIASELKRIESIADRKQLFDEIARSSAQGVDLVFDYYVWASGEDPDRNIVYLEQGGLGIADRTHYISEEPRSTEIRGAYRGYLTALFELAGAAPDAAKRDAEAALRIERALAQASLSPNELREIGNIFAEREFEELRKISPEIDWNVFFARQGIATPATASMAQPEFFRALGREMQQAPLDDWRAYLRARTLDGAAPYVGRAFRDRHFDFHSRTLRGVQVPPPRWRQVLDALNATPADMAMSRLFVDAHLSPEAKPRALAMVADLRDAFRARMESAKWMSDETRRAALKKLDRMGAKIGHPDRWPDLSDLRFDPRDYLGNMRAAARFSNRRSNAKLGRAVDRGEWVSSAHEINARYYPQTNEIVFPAPMLMGPAFDPTLDPALNYAALGIIIGHEMTHGFDDQGAQFAADGRLHDWWSAEDKRRFQAMTARVAERYSTFEIAPGKAVDGRLTLGENIADLGGLAIAYDALQRRLERERIGKIDGLDQRQRFFLRYASIWRNKSRPEFAELRMKTDPHAPDMFRALGPLADMPEFSQAFACKSGAPMHRRAQDRIGIW